MIRNGEADEGLHRPEGRRASRDGGGPNEPCRKGQVVRPDTVRTPAGSGSPIAADPSQDLSGVPTRPSRPERVRGASRGGTGSPASQPGNDIALTLATTAITDVSGGLPTHPASAARPRFKQTLWSSYTLAERCSSEESR